MALKKKKEPEDAKRTERLSSIRCTPQEKAAIEADAVMAGRTVALEIRWRLFPPNGAK